MPCATHASAARLLHVDAPRLAQILGPPRRLGRPHHALLDAAALPDWPEQPMERQEQPPLHLLPESQRQVSLQQPLPRLLLPRRPTPAHCWPC